MASNEEVQLPEDGEMHLGVLLQRSDRKRAQPEADQSDAPAGEKRMKVNAENFKCSICLSIWHDVVTLTPCQHNFCNACFSEWYSKSSYGSGSCKCPQCRIAVLYAGRNHAMRTVVEDLLASDPSLKRSAEEIEKMDKTALIKSNFVKLSDIPPPTPSSLARRTLDFPRAPNFGTVFPLIGDDPDSDSDSELGSDDDEDDVGPTCRQCIANSTSSYTCPPGAVHTLCSGCHGYMPNRIDITTPLECELCKGKFCDNYWRSQNLAPCPMGQKLQPMSEHQIDTMPLTAHKCNNEEKQFTKEYIDGHNLTVDAVVKDWMAKVDNAEIVLTNMPVTSSSTVCKSCANNVAAQLLDKFRMSIPKNDLPAAAAQRTDCWYGHACRTQRRPHHAAKFNHMCEPTSTRVVIGP